MPHILVTGAAGFIGRALCRRLVGQGYRVSGVTRRVAEPIAGVSLQAIGDITAQTDWRSHLAGVDIVVHLATSAHRPVDAAAVANEVKAAAVLAKAAAAAGVGRLVHVSSIRAMGEATAPGEWFCAGDPPSPQDAYGRAKLKIERAIAAAATSERLDLVMLRPPLVYGPGVKGNLHALIRLVATGIPLPLGGFTARRSLIFIDNLIDLLTLACVHPAAGGGVLLARDDVDLSIPELLRALGVGLGQRVRLYSVRPVVLTTLGVVPTLGATLRRLSLPLLIDDRETRSTVGWAPAIAPEHGLSVTAQAYLRR